MYFQAIDENTEWHWACSWSLWDLTINTCIKGNTFRAIQLSIVLFFFCILDGARFLSECCMMFEQMTHKNVYTYTIQFKQSNLLPDQRVLFALTDLCSFYCVY